MSSRAICLVQRRSDVKVSLFVRIEVEAIKLMWVGKKDGQVIMIKNNGQVEAYQVGLPPRD